MIRTICKNSFLKSAAIIFVCILALALFAGVTSGSSAFAEQTEINLADYNAFRWVDGSYNSLRDGTVYRYRYVYGGQWHDYYTTSAFSNPPNPEWEAWTLYSAVVAPCSVMEYKSDGNHTATVAFTGLKRADYDVVFSGDYSVGEAGEFVAKAQITLKNDAYRFVYETDSVNEITGRGMSVVIGADGSATVTKIWYVARFENNFLNEKESLENAEETPYSIPNWTFGQFPEGGVNAPRLTHGDEVKGHFIQPEGYRLTVEGWEDPVYEITDQTLKINEQWAAEGADVVTFALTLNGETICSGKTRSEWGYYFSEYMPAGKYTVKLTAKAVGLTDHTAWWSDGINFGAGTEVEYSGFSRVYSFEVYPAPLTLSIANSAQYQADLSNFSNGNFAPFFSEMLKYCTFSEYLNVEDITKTPSYWSDNFGRYYDETPSVTFNLAAAHDDVYLPADANFGEYIVGEGVYTVYYRAEMRNYSALSNGKSDYFEINFKGSQQSGTDNGETGSASRPNNTALVAVIISETVIICVLVAVLAYFAVKNRKKPQ